MRVPNFSSAADGSANIFPRVKATLVQFIRSACNLFELFCFSFSSVVAADKYHTMPVNSIYYLTSFAHANLGHVISQTLSASSAACSLMLTQRAKVTN
jgi:hypothetical protein